MEAVNAKTRKLLLGIDLGTSRTMIMSNRGAKETVRTVVGYPKDIIGVKILNRTSVFGDDALAKRSYMNLFFPLHDGVLKEASERDTEAARELLQHVISLANPQPDDEVYGILGVPARASEANKLQLLKITDGLMDLAMVISEPFMVAYGLNKLTNAIVIDIGAGTVDICVMRGTIPAPDDQLTLLKAGNFINEVLSNAISEAYPDVQMTPLLAEKIKEGHGFVGEPHQKAVVTLRSKGKPVPHDLTAEIRIACESVVPEILEGIKRLVTRIDPEDQEESLRNIILAGGGSRLVGLDQMLAEGLREYGEVSVSRVTDADYAGSAGALKLATELPSEYWSQVGETTHG
ncbi:MAG: rod shape-determining protein [Magnetococcales bacterium]|nr:rod shape-determining protein [Magnetococcales bacterium]